MRIRPSKDEYYLNIAREVSQRSTCHRVKFGAIIVKDDVIVATGYVGAPRKTKDCLERGFCLRDRLKIPHGSKYEICRSTHGEQNCVSGDSLTILPTGEIKKIESVHSPLLSLDSLSFKIQPSEGKRFEKNGKEVIKIITTGNHEIEVSPDHEMFVADKMEILKTKKAKDLTLNDFLPFANRVKIKSSPQFLPEVLFKTYKLILEGKKIFQNCLRTITWKKLVSKCGFSIQVIARLRKGNGIEKGNKNKLVKIFPQLSPFFQGLNFRKVKIPLKTNPEFCQVAGYFLGDGSIGKNYIVFYDENKKNLNFYRKLAKEVFNLNGKIRKGKGQWILTLCSYRLSLLFLKLNFGKGIKRKVPPVFQKIDNSLLARFLRGFADAEGTLGERSIHLSSSSKRLLEELRMLLLRFGIIAGLYKSKQKQGFEGYKKRISFSLEIVGEDLKTFYEKIGFSHSKKQRKLERMMKKREGKKRFSNKVYFKEWFRGNFPTTYFPLLRDYRNEIISKESARKILAKFEKFGYNRENLQKLKNLVENIIFLKIRKIRKLEKERKMIDYYVPKFNSFLVNGFFVHNCIINAARSGSTILNGDMYMWACDREGKQLDALPCFICKKMLINAGLKRVVCSTKENGIRIFNVEDWVKDWREKDILEDKYQYGKDLNQKDGLNSEI